MMDYKVKCKNCECACVRNGKSQNGKQRFYCKRCKKNFQLEYIYTACYQETTTWIIKLTRESCGVRSIARLLKISVATVLRKIKSLGRSISRPFFLLKGKEYEVDEMRTYIGNKKRLYWLAYAIRKDTREVVDFKVGKRTTKTLAKVVDTLLLSDAQRGEHRWLWIVSTFDTLKNPQHNQIQYQLYRTKKPEYSNTLETLK